MYGGMISDRYFVQNIAAPWNGKLTHFVVYHGEVVLLPSSSAMHGRGYLNTANAMHGACHLNASNAMCVACHFSTANAMRDACHFSASNVMRGACHFSAPCHLGNFVPFSDYLHSPNLNATAPFKCSGLAARVLCV